MKLGSYTFEWDPDDLTIPKKGKYCSYVLTYSSVAFFTFGLSIIGKIIDIPWDECPADQFERIQAIFEEDTTQTWYPELDDIIHYGSPFVNLPFEAGAVITGQTSGATATISNVFTKLDYIMLTGITGTFQADEVIKDDTPAPNQKSATITSLIDIPNYTVNIISWTGKYIKNLNTGIPYREDCNLRLLIMAQL